MKPDAYQFRCWYENGESSPWFVIDEQQMLNIRDNPRYEIRELYALSTLTPPERSAGVRVWTANRVVEVIITPHELISARITENVFRERANQAIRELIK
ncbi:hypothetical protein FBF48_10705 [Streptococcus salivarius]|uniref:Phage protein n=1 Tax=Streptococcus salivarius TaxID=1304 RepID=A0AAX2UZ65_STRSL|nr:hypothetical protein [Streptococcus salivarius]TNF64965.1 hypothetical protein FBF48_10705 [Streptococcus salivarius]